MTSFSHFFSPLLYIKGLPATSSEVPAESSEEEEHRQRRRRRPSLMSFDNDPGDENRGTGFPHSSAKLEEVVTPQKTSKQKGKKGSSSKKKRKRKRASPKKSGNDKPDEEVMSKLMAVKQMYVQNPMLIALSKEGQNSSPTRWDVSAQTLLNMTLTFLRHVPEVSLN